MASKGQLNGMRGVYLAAAELVRRGFIASPTSRSAAGADILATTHDCNRAFSVQVKTKTTKDPVFMLGMRAKTIKSRSHLYVLVHIVDRKGAEVIEYYVVPAPIIARLSVAANPNWTKGYVVYLSRIQKYKGKWALFGKPVLT